MAEGIRRLAKDTAIYGLSSIIGRFLNWMLVPLYVRVLDTTGEYGIVTNLYGWTALLLVLLTYGMETGFFRFVNKKEETEPMRVYGTTLYSVAFTSSLFFAGCLLFLQPVSRATGYADHPEYIGMMAGIVAVDAFCCIPFAYLRYRNKAFRFAAIKFLSIGLNIFLNIFFLLICPWLYRLHPAWIEWFYQADYGIGYIFVSNVFTSSLIFLLLIPYLLPGFRARMDPGRLKQLLPYSIPVLILGAVGVFNQNADKILFPYLFEDKDFAHAQLGIYGACFKIAVVMMLFIQAFRYAYEPFVFAKDREHDSRKAYAEAMKYFIIFALILFIGVMFSMDVLKYFVSPEYYAGLSVVPIVMLGELFYGIYFNLSVWYKLTDKTVWGARFAVIGCAVTIGIILLFVPRYGFMACAWATFASNLLMMLLSYFVGQKHYPVSYDLRSAGTYALLAAGLYAAGMIPPVGNIYVRLLYRTVLGLLFIGFVIRKDLPLSQILSVGRYFSRKNGNFKL
ncbi:MAG: polysaccharide biosynthesis C-terminal domain-containing protein [Tannerella sp.]|jgi:O-antigen/teichoic acid export membrane protein|nr:polysaccharide biosynthesis C-terminal domain-containing protein [Tannerella sp.]